MPDYFEGYETEVNFVTSKEVRELKKRASHCGRTITRGDGFKAETQVEMSSNADFTAKIMLRYANAIPALKRDGYFRGIRRIRYSYEIYCGKEFDLNNSAKQQLSKYDLQSSDKIPIKVSAPSAPICLSY